MQRRRFIRTVGYTSAALALRPLLASAQSNKLTAAVIGHTGRGNYGHELDTIFTGRANIDLVALADPDPTGRANAAKKLGLQRTYADYRELLERERPNLVSIAMRHADQHHAIALAALRSGAHIYCEKPFTVSPAESDELLAEAAKRKLRIVVAHTMRMRPALVELKRSLTEGLIGELVEMRAYGKQDNRAGGEDMMVLGTHLFDLLRFIAGDPFSCSARVQWKGRDIVPTDARIVRDNVGPVAGDEIFAHFSFPNGINATFTSAEKLRETTGHWGIELFGSKGVARILCDIDPRVLVRKTTGWKNEKPIDEWQPLETNKSTPIPPHNQPVVDDWLETIGTDREPECSGRNGAWAIEMVMAVYRAALSRQQVSFPLKEREHPLRVS